MWWNIVNSFLASCDVFLSHLREAVLPVFGQWVDLDPLSQVQHANAPEEATAVSSVLDAAWFVTRHRIPGKKKNKRFFVFFFEF